MYNPIYNRTKRTNTRMWCIKYLGGRCVNCGEHNELQFDHIIPSTKEYVIGANIWRKTQDLTSELDKCQLLCKICHKAKTKSEMVNWRHIGGSGRNGRPRGHNTGHGSPSKYTNEKCRCDICKRGWADYVHKRRMSRELLKLKEIQTVMMTSDELQRTVRKCIYGAFDSGFWDSNKFINMRLEEIENLRKEYLEDKVKEIVMEAEKVKIEYAYTEVKRLAGRL